MFEVVGLGIVGPFGSSKEAFWKFVNEKKPLNPTIQESSYELLRGIPVLSAKSFQPTNFYDEKQLHNLDRNSALFGASVKLAIRDAELYLSEQSSRVIGLSMGTSISIGAIMSDFYESVLRYGERRSDIGTFPNAVMNAPASKAAIFEHITGPNTTVSSGMNSGIDAIGYACLCLESGDADIMVAGASEALSEKVLLSFVKEGLLNRGSLLRLKPGRCGAFVPSEGACALIISREAETSRSPSSYCQLLSYRSAFSYRKHRDIAGRIEGLAATIGDCLDDAALEQGAIDCVLLGSYFDLMSFEVELESVRHVLGERFSSVPVLAPKKVLGESFAAFSAQLVVLAVGILNLEITTEAILYLSENNAEFFQTPPQSVLIVQTDPGGHMSALVLKVSEPVEARNAGAIRRGQDKEHH